MKSVSDKDYMSLALAEGKKGLGWVHPNPPVGAVIVDKSGNVVAKGWHRNYGGGHAEIDALKNLSDSSLIDGATMYVTLEPCAHVGKTPSCAQALAKLPLKRLVYGIEDPNPQVSGQGAEILNKAGIETHLYDGPKEELEELCEIFLWNMRKKKIFVALKAATSKDGYLNSSTGQRWITGAQSRALVHNLRVQYDAVLVGKNTFLDDDPALNVRSEVYGVRDNYAIVLDSRGEGLDHLAGSRLTTVRPLNKVIWVVKEGVKPKLRGLPDIKVIELQDSKKTGRLDLEVLLEKLFQIGINSLFLEGGAQVYNSFLEQDLVNRIYHFEAREVYAEKGLNMWLNSENLKKLSSVLANSKNSTFNHEESNLSLGGDLYYTCRIK